MPVRANLRSLLISMLAQRGSADLLACPDNSGLHVAVGAQLQDAASRIHTTGGSTTCTAAKSADNSPEQKHCTRARADLQGLLSLRGQCSGEQQQQPQQQQQQQQQQRQAEQVDEENDSIWIDSTSSSSGSAYGAWKIGFGCESPSPAGAAAAAGEPGLLDGAASGEESDELADMLQLLGV
jgi:hypothetical protein